MIDSVGEQIAIRAQAALRNSPFSDLREIDVRRDGDTLHLTGRVSSFYHKQLAQEAIRAIADGWCVVNEVSVD